MLQYILILFKLIKVHMHVLCQLKRGTVSSKKYITLMGKIISERKKIPRVGWKKSKITKMSN